MKNRSPIKVVCNLSPRTKHSTLIFINKLKQFIATRFGFKQVSLHIESLFGLGFNRNAKPQRRPRLAPRMTFAGWWFLPALALGLSVWIAFFILVGVL